jgi:hypothetical protein
LEELTSTQLAEWEAYNRINPIESWVEDFRMAYICTTMTNIAIRQGSKTNKLNSVADFMPDYDVTAPKEVKKQTVEQMKKAMQDIVKSQKRKAGIQPLKTRPPKIRK